MNDTRRRLRYYSGERRGLRKVAGWARCWVRGRHVWYWHRPPRWRAAIYEFQRCARCGDNRGCGRFLRGEQEPTPAPTTQQPQVYVRRLP